MTTNTSTRITSLTTRNQLSTMYQEIGMQRQQLTEIMTNCLLSLLCKIIHPYPRALSGYLQHSKHVTSIRLIGSHLRWLFPEHGWVPFKHTVENEVIHLIRVTWCILNSKQTRPNCMRLFESGVFLLRGWQLELADANDSQNSRSRGLERKFWRVP